MSAIAPLSVAASAADCERARDAWLAQPSNALSSIAYVIAGAALVRRAQRDGDHRALAAAYGCAVAANGVGGVAFHGPGGPFSVWLHDAALVSTLATMATVNIEAIAGRRPAPAPAVTATAVAGGVIAVSPWLSGIIQLVAGGLVAATEVVRVATPSCRARSRLRDLGPLLLLGAGAVVHASSRTGARWCDPDAIVQGHAFWHALSAGALWWWGVDRT